MPPKFAPETLRIYCAGPLFNRAERQEMTEIADRLCAEGFSVYLPHRDGMEFRLVHEVLVDRGWTAPVAGEFLHAAIFALDVYQLVVECDAMVWNLNGRTPDEGAVSEAAMAWTLGKPLVAYRDDVRSLIEGRVNPLLVGMVDFRTIDDVALLPEAISAAIAEQPIGTAGTESLSPRMRDAVDKGRQLWQAMQDAAAQNDDERIATVVAELFAPDDALRP